MIVRLLILLVLLLPIPAAVQAQVEPKLVPDVSQRNINIQSRFTGAELLLFGAISETQRDATTGASAPIMGAAATCRPRTGRWRGSSVRKAQRAASPRKGRSMSQSCCVGRPNPSSCAKNSG